MQFVFVPVFVLYLNLYLHPAALKSHQQYGRGEDECLPIRVVGGEAGSQLKGGSPLAFLQSTYPTLQTSSLVPNGVFPLICVDDMLLEGFLISISHFV